MKKLKVTFEGTTDTTGYLFSLIKCFSASLRCGGYEEYADDIIASSGFAFRMWVTADLCPSATSIWEFRMQKPWVENGGLTCDYVERLWDGDAIEQPRRLAAIEIIKKSIDNGVAAVAWDISGCEWGAIVGYDDETSTLYTFKINGCEDSIPYEKLGRLELPLLTVLTVTGKTDKPREQIVADTKKLAAMHLRGGEWCENAKGLEAYPALIKHFESDSADMAASWNMEYFLGTYAALKWYAWKFFEKYGEAELAGLYKEIYEAWKGAFDMKRSRDVTDVSVRKDIAALLKSAQGNETKAVVIMDK